MAMHGMRNEWRHKHVVARRNKINPCRLPYIYKHKGYIIGYSSYITVKIKHHYNLVRLSQLHNCMSYPITCLENIGAFI